MSAGSPTAQSVLDAVRQSIRGAVAERTTEPVAWSERERYINVGSPEDPTSIYVFVAFEGYPNGGLPQQPNALGKWPRVRIQIRPQAHYGRVQQFPEPKAGFDYERIASYILAQVEHSRREREAREARRVREAKVEQIRKQLCIDYGLDPDPNAYWTFSPYHDDPIRLTADAQAPNSPPRFRLTFERDFSESEVRLILDALSLAMPDPPTTTTGEQ